MNATVPKTRPIEVENIPPELRKLDQWAAWRWELRGGKWTKPPLCPATGRYARNNDPSAWGSFEEALRRARRDRLPGVGFVFRPEDPYAGADLDGCRAAISAAHPFEHRQVPRSAPELRVTAQAVHGLVEPSPILEPQQHPTAFAGPPGRLFAPGAMHAGPEPSRRSGGTPRPRRGSTQPTPETLLVRNALDLARPLGSSLWSGSRGAPTPPGPFLFLTLKLYRSSLYLSIFY